MILIKKLKSKKCANGNYSCRGLFLCSWCNKIVEKAAHTVRVESCGCRRNMGTWRYNKLYRVWREMQRRCKDIKFVNYKNYGGRGIKVCIEWTNFISFRDWALANGYRCDLRIDRKDNNAGYFPDNCRWITLTESNRNRRNVKLNEEKASEIRKKYLTGTYTQEELSKEYNIIQPYVSNVINCKNWKKIF